MKTNTLALLFLFSMLILPCQAQTIIKTSMNGQTIDILQKENVKNGKITFDDFRRYKGSDDFKKREYLLFFSKEPVKKGDYRRNNFKYNILSLTDSMQYIFIPNCMATIDHKKKTITLDTGERVYPYVNLTDLMAYYLENIVSDMYEPSIGKKNDFEEKIVVTDSAIFQYVEHRRTIYDLPDSYKDSVNAILENGKLTKTEKNFWKESLTLARYNRIYEFSPEDTSLISLHISLKNKAQAGNRTAVERKSLSRHAEFNHPDYDAAELYDYTNYAQGYEVELSFTKRMEINREKTLNKPAPLFELPVVNGDSTLKLEDYKGKWVLLDFWFMGCKPCLMLMPEIEELYAQYHKKGLEILGINIDSHDEKLQEFVKNKKIPYPTLNSHDRTASDLYNVIGYPTLILINPEQEVVVNGRIYEVKKYLEEKLKR